MRPAGFGGRNGRPGAAQSDRMDPGKPLDAIHGPTAGRRIVGELGDRLRRPTARSGVPRGRVRNGPSRVRPPARIVTRPAGRRSGPDMTRSISGSTSAVAFSATAATVGSAITAGSYQCALGCPAAIAPRQKGRLNWASTIVAGAASRKSRASPAEVSDRDPLDRGRIVTAFAEGDLKDSNAVWIQRQAG